MNTSTAATLVFAILFEIFITSNAPCPSLRLPENGFMVSDRESKCGSDIGNVCRLSCFRNYVVSGDSERVCQSNGQWSGRQATCVDPTVRCLPPLVAPNNGVIDGDCVNWGGFICTFSCNDGYTISGSQMVECVKSTRRWNTSAPTCEREVITCPPLNPPENGLQSGGCDGTNSLIGARCRFSCDSGYELQGSRSLVCQPNGLWNGLVPVCVARPVTCRSLRAPPNGYTTGDCDNNPSQGSRCTFQCNSGYELQGRSVLTCTSEGNWDGNVPACARQITSCKRLNTPQNGAMRCNQGMSTGSRCVFSCNSGYELEGQRVLTCLENGSWSAEEPKCEASAPTCSALDEPRAGKKEGSCSEGAAVGSRCRFSCNTGFRLNGASTLTCQADGNWDNEVPECVRQAASCPALDAPANGSRQGSCATTTSPPNSLCTFSCNPGFRLRGNSVLICLASGQWNSSVPTCIASQTNCPELNAPTNGAHRGVCSSRATSGSQCNFSCNSGYTLQGAPVLTCQANGQWNRSPPTCVQQQQQEPTCPALDAPENGSKGGACFEGARVGASCAFRCDEGYTLSGKETLVCQVDGTWDEEVPVCQEQPKNCPSLPNPVGGTATGDCNPGLDNRLCAFSCRRGYYLIGTPVLLCKDGSWSSRAPTCRRSSRGGCGLPVVPNGAIITFCKTLVGGRCYYACRYSSLRNNRAVDNMRRPNSLPREIYTVCQPNGRWRGRLISCRPGISSVSWILGFPFG